MNLGRAEKIREHNLNKNKQKASRTMYLNEATKSKMKKKNIQPNTAKLFMFTLMNGPKHRKFKTKLSFATRKTVGMITHKKRNPEQKICVLKAIATANTFDDISNRYKSTSQPKKKLNDFQCVYTNRNEGKQKKNKSSKTVEHCATRKLRFVMRSI